MQQQLHRIQCRLWPFSMPTKRPFSSIFWFISLSQHSAAHIIASLVVLLPARTRKKTSCRLVKWVHSRLASISLRIPVLFSLFIELSSDCVCEGEIHHLPTARPLMCWECWAVEYLALFLNTYLRSAGWIQISWMRVKYDENWILSCQNRQFNFRIDAFPGAQCPNYNKSPIKKEWEIVISFAFGCRISN